MASTCVADPRKALVATQGLRLFGALLGVISPAALALANSPAARARTSRHDARARGRNLRIGVAVYRLKAIREGSGDADLIQDVSDLLLLCSEHAKAIEKAPRGEANAVARLRELSPALARVLADKRLSSEAQRARKLRDAAHTLVMHRERRLRDAAEYWYEGTSKMKDYAPFPISRGAASAGEAEAGDAGGEDGAPEGDEPEEGATDEGAPEDGASGKDEEER